MGEQLNHTNAEVFYLDFSRESMKQTQKKTYLRQLTNILWVNDWIESIAYLGMGYFDLIICTGVLHHMKNPSRGSRQINEIQKDNGGAILMMYGQYGRTSVYYMQDLMRLVNNYEKNLQVEVSNAKRIIDIIPNDATFLQHNGDQKTMGDVGIYDLFLQKRDISFTTESLYEFVRNCSYEFVSYSGPKERIHINLQAHVITNSGFHNKHAIAELLIGNIKMHSFYVSKLKSSKALFSSPTMNIILNGLPAGLLDVINNLENYKNIGNKKFIFSNLEARYFEDGYAAKRGQIGSFYDYVAIFFWPFTDIGNFFLKLIANKTSSKTTLNRSIKRYEEKYDSKYTYKYMKQSLESLCWYFELSGMLFLRAKSISPYPKTEKPRVRLSLAGGAIKYSLE